MCARREWGCSPKCPAIFWRVRTPPAPARPRGRRSRYAAVYVRVFARDGTLFVTQGDRFAYRDAAQDLASGLGKIMRIHPDGTVPADNPFVGRAGAQREIWSYGHRNVQSAALHPETGQLWIVEHGPRGGDELNRPEAGKNYGWPVITYGAEYWGPKIGEGTAKPGMEQPLYYWDPVIAPSGLLFYTGDAISGWKGSLLIGSLRPGLLVRLRLADGRVAQEERYLGDLGERIRDVRQGPDGHPYLLTDSGDGRILRVVPASREYPSRPIRRTGGIRPRTSLKQSRRMGAAPPAP